MLEHVGLWWVLDDVSFRICEFAEVAEIEGLGEGGRLWNDLGRLWGGFKRGMGREVEARRRREGAVSEKRGEWWVVGDWEFRRG